ncbi:hypothetical protein EUGRSUZ_A00731 [Eucalyptus grandis]|uniref:Uncharacterized protein n=2 Tax=Eucalyptus grandis TaxID=71139 RepID=A0ACC3M0Z6_EUCGR|nr:hypothetical protein EUGRSUZ_A00731 [Eucalyptus grandis]
MGLNSFLNTRRKLDGRRSAAAAVPPWAELRSALDGARRGAGARLGSERLLPSMAWFSWTSKEIRSNRSSRVLCSSPNRFRTALISSTALACLASCGCCNHLFIFIVRGGTNSGEGDLGFSTLTLEARKVSQRNITDGKRRSLKTGW